MAFFSTGAERDSTFTLDHVVLIPSNRSLSALSPLARGKNSGCITTSTSAAKARLYIWDLTSSNFEQDLPSSVLYVPMFTTTTPGVDSLNGLIKKATGIEGIVAWAKGQIL